MEPKPSHGRLGAHLVLALFFALLGTAFAWSSLPQNPPQEQFRTDVQRGAIPIPDVIDVDNSGPVPPLWASADTQMARTGALFAPFLKLPATQAERLYDAMRLGVPGGHCLEFENSGPAGTVGTMAELVHSATAVVSGTVTAVGGGFRGGDVPALLVQFRVDEWLKPNDAYATKDSVLYFTYSNGNFIVGDVRICQHNRGVPRPPRVGERIMLFPHGVDAYPIKMRAYVEAGMDNEYGPIIGAAVGLRAPGNLSGIAELSVISSFEQMEEIVRAIVREGRGR